MIDIERRGKILRQKGRNTLISKHNLKDISKIKKHISNAKIITRINSIYALSKLEINKALDYGTDYIMLPFYKTREEVSTFLNYINNPNRAILLCETKESFNNFENIHKNFKPFLIYIGLNDLHLELSKKFIFEILTDPHFSKVGKAIDKICNYGFGGIANLDEGIIPGKMIALEHHYFNSNFVILSRTFFNGRTKRTSFENFLKLKEFFKTPHSKKYLDLNHENVINIINEHLKQI